MNYVHLKKMKCSDFCCRLEADWRIIMEEVRIKDEFIKLGQALKLAGLVESGVDAKYVVQDGQVKVNGVVETQRGKKLVNGDEVTFEGKTFVIRA